MKMAEEREELRQLFAQAYLYEPEYTDAELEEMEREEAARLAEPVVEERDRTVDTWWCQCDGCRVMDTQKECLCCTESDIFQVMLENGPSPYTCVVENPEFPPLITRGVLNMVFRLPRINWKKRPDPQGENGTLSIE